ncbi:MAG: NUDIX domain-containing protein [Candidatus Odinarchaeota archaeon]
MTKMIPIAITILSCKDRYIFLKRRNPPYEGLWSLVGGKIITGEHIQTAAKREIVEETGTTQVQAYNYRGIVSERLVDRDGTLSAHFLIFVGHAIVDDFKMNHHEGTLSLFTTEEIDSNSSHFLPSDLEMFRRFREKSGGAQMHEAELLHDEKGYHLTYYRVIANEH